MSRFVLLLILTPCFALAQSVDVKGVETQSDGSTTIEIHKGNKPGASCEPIWSVETGTADISGDADAMTREAKSKWKTACDDWKKEIRQDNKENKIISLNCGLPACSGETGAKTCASQASYKIKTKLN